MWRKILFIFKYETEVITLGGNSDFDVIADGTTLFVTLSTKTTGRVDEALFELVYERYKKLRGNEKRATNSYTDPNWNNCPNRIFSPAVAAIIVYLEDKKYI